MGLLLICPRLGLSEDDLCTQLVCSYTHPDPVEAVNNCGLYGSSTQVLQSQLQAASDIHLHQSSSQNGPRTSTTRGGLQTKPEHDQPTTQLAHSQGDLSSRHFLLGPTLIQGGGPHSGSYTVVRVDPYSQPACALVHSQMG